MKLRYLLYGIKCYIMHEIQDDYIDWLATKLFIHKWRGEKRHA